MSPSVACRIACVLLVGILLRPCAALAGEPVFVQNGLASWYGPGFEGRRTASGSIYRQRLVQAAHRRLPLGTVCTVTSLVTGRSVRLTVTDRGPYVGGRILDLSRGAAEALGIRERGVSAVRIEAWATEQADPDVRAGLLEIVRARTALARAHLPPG